MAENGKIGCISWFLLILGLVLIGICFDICFNNHTIIQEIIESHSQKKVPKSNNNYHQVDEYQGKDVQEKSITEVNAGKMIMDGFEYNARLVDKDGDHTNIRNAPKGTIVDVLYSNGANNGYYMYLSYKEGNWWRIRDSKVYDKSTGMIRILNGDQCWIHNSCFNTEYSSINTD